MEIESQERKTERERESEREIECDRYKNRIQEQIRSR